MLFLCKEDNPPNASRGAYTLLKAKKTKTSATVQENHFTLLATVLPWEASREIHRLQEMFAHALTCFMWH